MCFAVFSSIQSIIVVIMNRAISYQSLLIVSLSWTLTFHVSHSKFTSFVNLFEFECLSVRFFFENLTELTIESSITSFFSLSSILSWSSFVSSRSSSSKWWKTRLELRISYLFVKSSYSIRLSMSWILIRFFFFSIFLNLSRIFSKVLSISNKVYFWFLYILTNCWKFAKTIRYLSRSMRNSLNSFKKSLKWLLIHHFNWRTISMFKECVISSFSFETKFDVKKIWRNL